MAYHKLSAGKRLIEGITDLGQVLGYHIEQEFPVDEPIYGESPAVDVAWFSQKENRFPLFIFEVESKATNGMTNNPLKVYAQENRAFEKPLFFFHVVAQGGVHSSRPKNLEAQYGKNNYRIYLIGIDGTDGFIRDILSQHSRVREDVDYLSLHQVLTSEVWPCKVGYSSLLAYAVELGLSKESVISSYVRICRHDPAIFPDLVKLIIEDSKYCFANTYLDSYIGGEWHAPIFYSLLCGLSADKNESEHWSSMLLEWQNKSSYMPMITPSFGLSRDYDEFILGCAPQLITLCIASSSNNGSFSLELVKVIEKTLDKMGVCWEGLNSAIYLLHVSSALGAEDVFKKAKNYLLEFKELAEKDLFHPPSCVSFMEEEFEDYFHYGEGIVIPEMGEFARLCLEKFQKENLKLENIVLRALDDESYIFEWSNDLLEALWSKVANKGITDSVECRQDVVSDWRRYNGC